MSHIIALLEAALLSLGPPPSTHREPHAYVVDVEASHLYVVVHKGGLLSFLGHEHAIAPAAWTVELCLDDPLPAGARASLVLKTDSLVIDSDSARALAGMGGGPGEEDRATIRARMLDSTNLDAAHFPEIRLELQAAEPSDSSRVTVEGTIALRGVVRDVRLPVEVERGDQGRLILSGVLSIHQRDFGIEPESRAGVVKVSNDVDLHFHVSALPTDRPCAVGADAGGVG